MHIDWKWMIIGQCWVRSASVSEARRVKSLQINSEVTTKRRVVLSGLPLNAARRHDFQTQTATLGICVSRRQALSSVPVFFFSVCVFTRATVENSKKSEGIQLLQPALCFLNLLQHTHTHECCTAFQRHQGVSTPRVTLVTPPHSDSLLTRRPCDYCRRSGRRQVDSLVFRSATRM